jgi:hypothetical protein
MAKPCDSLDPQAIPEATEEGHLPEFRGPGGDEEIGLDVFKNLEQERDFRRIMLPIGIERDDHLIVLSEDPLEPGPKGCTLSKIERMFEEFHAMFGRHPLRLICGSVIDDKGIDLERFNLA